MPVTGYFGQLRGHLYPCIIQKFDMPHHDRCYARLTENNDSLVETNSQSKSNVSTAN